MFSVPKSRLFPMTKVVVVGSGFYGLTVAHLIAEQLQIEVLVLESRDHVGGNAFSYLDSRSGIEIHKYGSHLFHTSNEKVWLFINQFSKFNDYRHVVWTNHLNRIYSMPINLNTINTYLMDNLSPSEANFWIQSQQSHASNTLKDNFESKAISLIGKPLYEAFIRGYTKKQWQIEPALLPADVISRLPVRTNYNNYYFDDTYQGLPLKGYFGVFDELLRNQRIKISLSTDFFEFTDKLNSYDLLIFTGPIDRFFNYKHGILGWRTLNFEFEHHAVRDYQGCAVMNYADEIVPYTRSHEFKHLHPERKSVFTAEMSVTAKEYSRVADFGDEPYYPINTEIDRAKLKKYRIEAKKLKNVLFGGRLGTYQYLDMHMAIASAISDFENKIKTRLLN